MEDMEDEEEHPTAELDHLLWAPVEAMWQWRQKFPREKNYQYSRRVPHLKNISQIEREWKEWRKQSTGLRVLYKTSVCIMQSILYKTCSLVVCQLPQSRSIPQFEDEEQPQRRYAGSCCLEKIASLILNLIPSGHSVLGNPLREKNSMSLIRIWPVPWSLTQQRSWRIKAEGNLMNTVFPPDLE